MGSTCVGTKLSQKRLQSSSINMKCREARNWVVRRLPTLALPESRLPFISCAVAMPLLV